MERDLTRGILYDNEALLTIFTEVLGAAVVTSQ